MKSGVGQFITEILRNPIRYQTENKLETQSLPIKLNNEMLLIPIIKINDKRNTVSTAARKVEEDTLTVI